MSFSRSRFVPTQGCLDHRSFERRNDANARHPFAKVRRVLERLQPQSSPGYLELEGVAVQIAAHDVSVQLRFRLWRKMVKGLGLSIRAFEPVLDRETPLRNPPLPAMDDVARQS